MADRFITLGWYYDYTEALVCKSKLDQYGFLCFLTGAGHASVAPWLETALQGYQLRVLENDVDDAADILADKVEDPKWEKCPECESGRIFRPVGLLSAVLSFLIAAGPVRKPTQSRYCLDCRHRWKIPPLIPVS